MRNMIIYHGSEKIIENLFLAKAKNTTISDLDSTAMKMNLWPKNGQLRKTEMVL